MSLKMIVQLIFFSLFFLSSTAVYAEDLLKNLQYPELQVTPLASERLRMEVKRERGEKWTGYWAIQASALTTLFAASSANGKFNASTDTTDSAAKSKQNKDAVTVANMIGVGWLGATVALSIFHTPYRNAFLSIKKLPHSKKRDKLVRERLAEAALVDAASLANKIKWMSFITNLASNAYVAGNTDDEGAIVAALGALLSATPLLFESRWEKAGREHQDYKKRIYGPVAGTVLLKDGQDGYIPGFSLQMAF